MSTTEHLKLAGLSAKGEIHVDEWGVSHIRAANRDDLFFLQGFNAATNRLWQIDLWRKRGLGRLAADFGPGFLEQDRAARLFLYRGPIAPEWQAYGPGSQGIVEAFVKGINAFITRTEADPGLLPPEFSAMGTRPERWDAEDVVRIRSHGMSRNAWSEILRAHILAGHAPQADLLRHNLEPPITPEAASPIDLAKIPLHALDTFRLSSATPQFSKERLAATLDQAKLWRSVNGYGEVLRSPEEVNGSNNWAIAGDRSGTGKPILASDPHREHSVPGLRMLVHLSCPGLELSGAGEAAIPGVAFGHNTKAAWAVTIFYIDQEDVFVYDLDPARPDHYRYGEGHEAMTFITETFKVKGYPDQTIALPFTRHGPVVHQGKDSAVAVKTVWQEPGTAPYMASLRFMDIDNIEDFRKATFFWRTPSVNFAYADAKGSIGWMPTGAVPIRKGWDGLLPVPGDGRFEWQGIRDPSVMPTRFNPPEGFIFSANAMNLPADWDHKAKPLGHEWIERSRANRIEEVLSSQPIHGVPEACALQTDKLSLPARRIGKLLDALASTDSTTAKALSLLRDWDHHIEASSPAAALYEIWFARHLKPALFATIVPDPAQRLLFMPGDIGGILKQLEQPSLFSPETRDALLLTSLKAAYEALEAEMGRDPAGWTYARFQQGLFIHPLADVVKEAKDWNVGPLAKGGSYSTPMMAATRPDNGRIYAGASFRMVVDLADLDRSVCINTPGQSGDPRSPHYRDLAPLWAAGDYIPMLVSPARIAEHTEKTIHLTPG